MKRRKRGFLALTLILGASIIAAAIAILAYFLTTATKGTHKLYNST